MTITQLEESLGFVSQRTEERRLQLREELLQYISLKLTANGYRDQPQPPGTLSLGPQRILNTYYQRLKHLDAIRCPADKRIESFLDRHFEGVPWR